MEKLFWLVSLSASLENELSIKEAKKMDHAASEDSYLKLDLWSTLNMESTFEESMSPTTAIFNAKRSKILCHPRKQ